MRTRLLASVVVILLGGLWLNCASAATRSEPVQWSEESGLSEPKAISKVNPTYPEEAREEKAQGAVVLELTIGTDGEVRSVEVVQDPDPRLSQAAVDAVRQWKFEPARTGDGAPVAVLYKITVAFKLQ